MSNNNSFNSRVVEGLAPALNIPQVGVVYRDTTEALSAKIADELRNTLGIVAVDNVMITPKLANNSVGISDIQCRVFFDTRNHNQKDIFYRGKGGNNNSSDGRVNLISSSTGGGGQFGTSDNFKRVFSPLCKVNEQGKTLMNIKSVPKIPGIAELEVDFNAILCIVLGITSDDDYDFAILNWTPISATNFSIMVMKFIATTGGHKGKNSSINYARIEQENLRRLNGGHQGGNNGGGRSY